MIPNFDHCFLIKCCLLVFLRAGSRPLSMINKIWEWSKNCFCQKINNFMPINDNIRLSGHWKTTRRFDQNVISEAKGPNALNLWSKHSERSQLGDSTRLYEESRGYVSSCEKATFQKISIQAVWPRTVSTSKYLVLDQTINNHRFVRLNDAKNAKFAIMVCLRLAKKLDISSIWEGWVQHSAFPIHDFSPVFFKLSLA